MKEKIEELLNRHAEEWKKCAEKAAIKLNEGAQSAHTYFEGKRSIHSLVVEELYELLKELQN